MKKLIIIALSLIITLNSNAQSVSRPSIAVANPNVQGLSFESRVIAKMMQLELIKLDKFSVYDEFDMAEVLKGNPAYSENCYGINCLTSMGRELKVKYVMSGSFNGLGDKIAVSLKWIDVKSGTLYKSVVREFDNQDTEIQRMIKVLLYEMNGMELEQELVDRLKYNNEPIISNDVGRVNNSGPRLGYSYMVGTFEELAKRPEDQGGLDIFPGVSSIGYQFEGQYVGTENFSALVEGIFNVSGLEQGQFIPSFSLLNGFRFGQSGWEFAFGPSFTLKRTSKGFFDNQGLFGKGEKAYFSERDWSVYASDNFKHNDADSTYYINGTFTNPTPFDVANNTDYNYGTHLDARGDFKLSANWLMAFGRTFKAGSLNIPVNIYYASSKGGGNAGVSVGFNVAKSKKNINSSRRFDY